MTNNTTPIGSYKLAHLDSDMNKVRKAVVEGEFESLVTVENALAFLNDKAALLGSELPASFVQEVRTTAVTRSLERSERYPEITRQGERLLEEARRSLAASDQPRFRFFSDRARDYFEKNRLPTGAIERLEEKAVINPFFTFDGTQEAPRPAEVRTIDPFE